MLKGYYINETCYSDGIVVAPGVENKICQQISVLSDEFDISRVELLQKKGQYIRKRLPLYAGTYNYKKVLNKLERPDFVYFRKCRLERGLLLLFKGIKSQYPQCKNIMEVSTYPYDKEFIHNNGHFLYSFPFYIKDVFYRNCLYKYIDRVVIYARPESTVFQIPALHAYNGINVNDFPLRKLKNKEKNDEIVLLAVANFQSSHGYERVIRGISIYYNNGGQRNIKLYMVGDGKERSSYVNLVNKLQLNDRVEFLGKLTGEALDSVYDEADIGLGCFGLYKFGLYSSSALKIREYLARGLPVASGCTEDVLSNKGLDFFEEFSNNEEAINMNDIIDLYERCYVQNDILTKIRDYALRTVDMKISLRSVIDYIKE